MPRVAAFTGLAMVLAASATLFAGRARGDPTWPEPGIRVSPVLQPCVDMMLRRSQTFRLLYHAIGRRTDLRVALGFDGRPAVEQGDRRAETTIRRIGPLREAEVVIYDADHPVELIAHELEHVREQMEGLNLRLMATAHWSGVVRLWDGTFETRRAQETGLEVADQVGGGYGRLCLSMTYVNIGTHPQ